MQNEPNNFIVFNIGIPAYSLYPQVLRQCASFRPVFPLLAIETGAIQTLQIKESAVVANLRKLAIGFVLVSLTVAAYAQNPFDTHKQFSATMVMSGASTGPHAPQGDMKIYRLNDKMRTNIGSMGYSIIDMTQHTMYMVMGQGMCMQMTPKEQQNPFAAQGSVERTPAGTDTVDGHTCKVENVTVTSQSGTPTKMKVWLAEDLQEFPVKVEIQSSRGPVTVHYKDISFDAPAASLFAHPDDCREMPTMPGAPQ